MSVIKVQRRQLSDDWTTALVALIGSTGDFGLSKLICLAVTWSP